MDLEEKMKERPRMIQVDVPGFRYVTTETMERMTRVFPTTKVQLKFNHDTHQMPNPYTCVSLEFYSNVWEGSVKRLQAASATVQTQLPQEG